MKILHVLDHSLPLHSGYTFRSAAILREQRARGWETLHLTTPRHGASMADFEQADGLEFHRTQKRPTVRRLLPVVGAYADEMEATRRRLEQLVRAHRPDVIHAHSPVLNVLPALRVGKAENVPVVYEIRAFWEDAAVDHGTTREGSLRYRATRALETHAARHADGVVVICEGLRGELQARGIPADRITVVPNAVDAEQFAFDAPPDLELRRSLGLDGKIVLGFLGSFYAYEGLDLLLEALSRLLPTHPEVRLLLAGGGPEEAGLKSEASALGVTDQVRFAGRIPHSKVARYYSLVDVLVYPRHPMRLTNLVTPLKPLEAMALGRIVVASDVGGHRELIQDGQTGFLFPAGNAQALADRLQQVIAQRSDWDALRLRGRRFVEEERSWQRSVAAYDALYERVCRGRSPSQPAVPAFDGTAESLSR
jgi:PEP-CTERM/exosortase A-associated glycosyltransferase